jgi:hypothetical protein
MTKCAHCGRETKNSAHCHWCRLDFCPRCTDEWQCPECGACVIVDVQMDSYVQIKTLPAETTIDHAQALLRVLNRRS